MDDADLPPDLSVIPEVTAPLTRWADALPERLERQFDCVTRPITTDELARHSHRDDGTGPATAASYAVVPAGDDEATLLVLRHPFHGGEALTLAFGRVAAEDIPCCDECAVLAVDAEEGAEEGAEEPIEQHAEELVWSVTRGFAEFRRPHRPADDTADDTLLHRGPWLEEGWFGSAGGSEQAGPGVAGETFERIWRPWRRRARPSR